MSPEKEEVSKQVIGDTYGRGKSHQELSGNLEIRRLALKEGNIHRYILALIVKFIVNLYVLGLHEIIIVQVGLEVLSDVWE